MQQSISILGLLALGALTTLKITVGAFAIAVILGFFLGIAATSSSRFVKTPILIYVEFFRTVPALTLLFAIYFGLPGIGISLPSVPAAMVGLGLMGAASLCEVFRAGILSVGKGQQEAARAVGMRPLMILRFIVLPQATRLVLPSIGSYSIMLVKDTSVASAIAAPEIMFYARQLVQNTFQTGTIYLLVAVIYLGISLLLSRLTGSLETWSKGRR